MSARRWSAGLVILTFGLAFVGCSGGEGHYDYGFRSDDAVGTWESVNTISTISLVLRDDGTFSAQGWPQVMNCDGEIPEFTRDSDDLWRTTIGYSGTWEVDGESAEYLVQFISPGPECRSNWAAVAWTNAGQPADLKIYLDPLSPSDDATEDQYIYLCKK